MISTSSEEFKTRQEALINDKLLQQSEDRFRAIFEQAPMAIGLFTGRDMVIEIGNERIFELWGKQATITGLKLIDAIPEIRDQPFLDILQKVYDTGIPFYGSNVKARLVRGGIMEDVYFDFTYTALRDPGGVIIGVMALAIEITQQVLARQSMEASEAKLRSVIATAPAAMGLFVGRDLIVEMPNQAFIDIVGKGPDIVGKPLREVMPELDSQPFLQILDEVYTSGKTYKSDGIQVNIIRHGTMTYNFYNITYSPLRNSQGEIYAILDIAIDVTETVRAQQELQQAQQSLKDAIELAELGTWTFDPVTRQMDYDERMQQWLGMVEKTRPLSKGISNLLPHEREMVAQSIEDALDPRSGGHFDLEYHIVNGLTGKTRLIHAQAKTFFDINGRPLKMMGTAQDITAQRQTEAYLQRVVAERTAQLDEANEQLKGFNEELQTTNEELADLNKHLMRSNEELQQFAHVTSHDLKEPLRKIYLYVDKLVKEAGAILPASTGLYINRINTACDRMLAMINGVLQYSTVDTGQQPFGSVSLQEVMDNVADDLAELITAKQAKLQYENLPVVEGVSILLYQLFYNLIINALKFSRSEVRSEIQISAGKVEYLLLRAVVKISVTDNGIGFEEKFREEIFKTFGRLHSKDKYEGTGLGLALCKRIAERHGGSITANGVLGKGATFIITLPLVANGS